MRRVVLAFVGLLCAPSLGEAACRRDSGSAWGNNPQVSRYYCDTEAEIPSAGLSAGDYAFAADTNKLFIYTATAWAQVNESTEAGATAWGAITGTLSAQTDLQAVFDAKAPTAHNHDAAYEAKNTNIQAHVGAAHAPADAQKNSDITKAEIEAKLTGELTSHTHAAGAGGGVWGDITGTLTDQTDLQDALNTRSTVGHGHAQSDVTNLVSALAGKEAANANIQAHIASAHAPSGAEVNVNADWNAGSGDAQILNKPATFAPSAHSHVDADIPNTVTIDVAATATALAADPTDCATSTHFAVGVNASGVPSCEAIADADVPNTITVDLAATATALAANGANCAATQFALGVSASGVAECAQPAFTDVSGSVTDAQVPNTITVDLATLATTATTANAGDSATGFFPAGTLEVARGGTNLTASADDNLMVGNGTTWETKAVPSCSAAGSALTYTTASNTWGCTTLDVAPTTLTASSTASDAVIATYTAIPGIAFTPAAAAKYRLSCLIRYTSTAATTGITFAWDVPTAASIFMTGYTTTTAAGLNEGFWQRADAIGGVTTSAVITVENVAFLEAQLLNGANATSTTLGFSPETANSVSVIAGSICQVSAYP